MPQANDMLFTLFFFLLQASDEMFCIQCTGPLFIHATLNAAISTWSYFIIFSYILHVFFIDMLVTLVRTKSHCRVGQKTCMSTFAGSFTTYAPAVEHVVFILLTSWYFMHYWSLLLLFCHTHPEPWVHFYSVMTMPFPCSRLSNQSLFYVTGGIPSMCQTIPHLKHSFY